MVKILSGELPRKRNYLLSFAFVLKNFLSQLACTGFFSQCMLLLSSLLRDLKYLKREFYSLIVGKRGGNLVFLPTPDAWTDCGFNIHCLSAHHGICAPEAGKENFDRPISRLTERKWPPGSPTSSRQAAELCRPLADQIQKRPHETALLSSACLRRMIRR